MCGKQLFLIGSLLLFLLASNLKAQSFEDIAAKYPNNYAVIQNYTKTIEISLKDDQPFAESKTEEEILALDDKANGMYNRQYVYSSTYDQLKDLEAYTKVPNGKKYNKIKVTDIKTENSPDNSIFYDDTKESTFDLPSLIKGSIASISYTHTHKDVHLLSPLYCVSYLPIVHENFVVKFPAGMLLKYAIKNDKNNIIKVDEDNKGSEHTYTFTANDVQPQDKFSSAPSYAYYEPHIILQLVSYKNDNNEIVPFLGNVDDLYKWDYNFISDVVNSKEETLKQVADSITGNTVDARKKAEKIYQWVQSNIKYVAFEDGLEGFVPRSAINVYNHRFGDCKDMASILTALLKAANLNAYFTWIGTRDIPYDYTDVPSPICDNHMIAALKLDSGWIFLDATDPNCVFGMPTAAIQGKQALIAISKDNYQLERIPEVDADKNVIVDSTFINITSDGIQGKESVYYSGYLGSDVYNSLIYRDAKQTRDYVKYRMGKASNKFMMDDYSINKLNTTNKLVNIQAGFNVPDYGKKISDEYFINLILEKLFTDAIIDTAKRKVPVESEYKYIIKQYTILELPADYSVNYLPKDYSSANNFFDVSIKYSKQENKIIALQEIHSNYLLLQPVDFDAWNNALKQLFNQYKEQVVLEKNK